MSPPKQAGELLPAVGAVGVWFIVTEIVLTGPTQVPAFAITV